MNDVFVGRSRFGRGAFAAKSFREGQVLFEYRGKLYRREDNPKITTAAKNHFMQIGENLYLGPTRGPDTAANHSCDPNSRVVFLNGKVFCVALRAIDIGEEITWDYSTTMQDDPWSIPCECGSLRCRGVIREFCTLPAGLQQEYIERGLVPAYILKRIMPEITISVARASSHSVPAVSHRFHTLHTPAGL